MRTDHYFDSCGAGQIHYCKWTPEGEIRGIVQIVHGIAERLERYTELLGYIASCGGVAVIHDLRGHGRSVPNPRLIGHCGDLYETCRTDIDAVYYSINENPVNRFPYLYKFNFHVAKLINNGKRKNFYDMRR